MEKIIVTDIEVGTYKEMNFQYKGLRFVYKYVSTSGWDDGTLIDLNKEDVKLSTSDFEKLEQIINNQDINELETGDEIDVE
jgi:hypothetical protein